MIYKRWSGPSQWHKIDFENKVVSTQPAIPFVELRKTHYQRLGLGDNIIDAIKNSDGPPIFTEVARQVPSPPHAAAISPNGISLLLWCSKTIVVNESDRVHVAKLPIDLEARAFSWNPDSTAVAFYYADTPSAEKEIQQYGLAMVTVKGEFTILRNSEEALPTPHHFASKCIPPQWGPGGEYVYYYEGIPKDKLEDFGLRQLYHRMPAAKTCRINIHTKEIETIAYGTFVGVLPGGDQILLSQVVAEEAEKPFHDIAVYDLENKKLTVPKIDAHYPKMSPSGKYLAALNKGTIHLYRVSDWQKIGESPSMAKPILPVDEWFFCYTWIAEPVEGEQP